MKTFGIAGWSGSGKTTLLVRLVPVLVRRGVEVATIKHTHHVPAIGTPETRALAEAGAVEVMVASPLRCALVHELQGGGELVLGDVDSRLHGIDLLLVEGFKFGAHPKLEVWDPGLGKPMLAPEHPSVVAIATDDAACDPHGRPAFARGDVEAIADFILSYRA